MAEQTQPAEGPLEIDVVPEDYTLAQRLHVISSELARHGIAKQQYHDHSRFYFRGIDDVYNALAGLLVSARVQVVPGVESVDHQLVTTSNGKAAMHVFVHVTYKLVNVDDTGDFMELKMIGEGFDTADKALNKALSAAYKLTVFQLFCVPTEEQSFDAEQGTAEIGAVSHTVGEEELVELRRWLEETSTDEAAFCEWQKIDGLESLPMDRFAHACDALRRKQERMQKEAEK